MSKKGIIFLILVCLPLKFAQLSAESTGTIWNFYEFRKDIPAMDLTDIKSIPDLFFECQIAQIASNSTVPMFYNPLVREYIEIYLLGRIKQVPELSLLSFRYFPLFEAQLENSGLPIELKYIPVIESGLNPLALSPSGAKGLWQFMAETGRSYGLVVNEAFDERSDPEKSTQAACEYIKHLHGIFGDWQLSLLAYHAGPSTIKKAIAKAGGKTSLEDIYAYLPVPTQRYLPAYIAVIYVLNNYKNHI
jgi:membrane-bound lytic murein transglycosylase D